MRNPMDTIPDPTASEEKFDDFWQDTAQKWGVNQERLDSLRENARQKQDQDESFDETERPTLPEMVLNDEGDIVDTVIMTRDEMKRELMFLLIEESVFKVRTFDFEEIRVKADKPHIADAISRSFGAICEKYDLLLKISLADNSFTILKKQGIDYTGRAMETEDGFVFHSLLNNYPNRVTIK